MPRSKNKPKASGAVRHVVMCPCGFRKAPAMGQMDTAWRLHGKVCVFGLALVPSKMALPKVHLLGTTTVSRTPSAADLELHKEMYEAPLYAPTQVAKP